MSMHSRYFTRSETAQLLGVSSQMVSVYVKQGLIKPIVFKRPYLFRLSDVEELNTKLEAKRNGFFSTSD